jgi:hypothetical protein
MQTVVMKSSSTALVVFSPIYVRKGHERQRQSEERAQLVPRVSAADIHHQKVAFAMAEVLMNISIVCIIDIQKSLTIKLD